VAPTCEHETGTCHPNFEHCSVRAWSCRLKSKGGKKRYFCGSNSAFLGCNCSMHGGFMYIILLVGGVNPSEKYEFVSWDDEIPNIWKKMNKKCSKPPTRYLLYVLAYPKHHPVRALCWPRSATSNRLLEMTPASAAGPEAESPRISLIQARN